MNPLTASWLAELVVITYRGAKDGAALNYPIPHLTLPSVYASTFIIYGALSFVPGEGQKVAGAIGWGIVVATVLNLWTPGKTAAGKPTVTVSPTAANQITTRNVDTGVTQTGA